MLGENIKAIRNNKGYTQEELAAKLNVTRQTVSKWEKGYSVPDADVLERMAEILEVDIEDLLGKGTPAGAIPEHSQDILLQRHSSSAILM